MTRWDVCWANVKFEDSGENKKRPVLIINNKEGYILAFKMTHIDRDNPLEYRLKDWQEANLNEPTTVRLRKKITFSSEDKLIPIGKISKTDIDNIKELIKKYNISLTEGKMKDISIGIENAGNKEAYIIQLEDELRDLNEYRDYLDTTGRKEVGKGGNFDSINELEDAIKETESKMDEINNKLTFLNK